MGVMAGAGLNTSIELYGTGFGSSAWPFVEALRVAAELDGGLTRPNLMLALHAFSGDAPFLIDGIEFGMNGNADAYYVEGSEVSAFNAADGSWIQESVIDLNGSTPNCSWGQAGCE